MHDPDSSDPGGPAKIDRLGARRTDPAREAGRAHGASEAGELERNTAVQSARSIDALSETGSATEIAQIHDGLASGAIDAHAARSQLIDHIVRAQLPAHANAELVDACVGLLSGPSTAADPQGDH